MNISFGANKTYFRENYCGVNSNWYRKSWKEFDKLKNIDRRYCCSNYYDVTFNKYGVKCKTSLKFEKIKTGLVIQILTVGVNGILDIDEVGDL